MNLFLLRSSIALFFSGLLCSCAADKKDPARPSQEGSERKSLQQRMNEQSGFAQDSEGNWTANSTKRSSYDSQRDSAYFRGSNSDGSKKYKTGEYAKKGWWGKKDYATNQFAGNTDGSRFKTTARQSGMSARDATKSARIPDAFETNTLGKETARESGFTDMDPGSSDYVEGRRADYVAPSVIGWKEQRSMSVGQSRSLLGR